MRGPGRYTVLHPALRRHCQSTGQAHADVPQNLAACCTITWGGSSLHACCWVLIGGRPHLHRKTKLLQSMEFCYAFFFILKNKTAKQGESFDIQKVHEYRACRQLWWAAGCSSSAGRMHRGNPTPTSPSCIWVTWPGSKWSWTRTMRSRRRAQRTRRPASRIAGL